MNGVSSLPEGAEGACRSLPTRELEGRADRVAVCQLSETWPGPAWRHLLEYGRRTEGGGDARKVIRRCLPPASHRREFRAIDDQRLKSTSEGVPATVRRWPAGTEGGAKAPACDGKANFIEGVIA